jgi:hypothetical protein
MLPVVHDYGSSRSFASRGAGGLLSWLPPPWPASLPAQQRWALVLTVLGLYSAFTTPFRLAFLGASLDGFTHQSSNDFNSFGLFIDLVFITDTGARTAPGAAPGAWRAARGAPAR